MVLDKSNKPKTGQGNRLARHEGGSSRKRGCLAKFSIKQFYLWPLVAQITYYQVSHTDKYGLPCHGIADSTSVKEKAQHKPWISQDMKLWIEQELARRLKPQQILAEHFRMVKTKVDLEGEGNMTRDDCLKMKDVLNIARKWNKKKYQQHPCDTTSVNMWIQEHPESVFFYQEASAAADTCFTLGIQLPWQQKKMCDFGHKSLVACDATFGTNKYKVSVHFLSFF